MAARALPLAKALARRGHRVTLVLPPWSHPEDSGRRWDEDGVRIVNVVLPQAPGPLFHLLLARRVLAATLATQPDVVHCFKPKAYSGAVQWALSLRPGRSQGIRLILDEDDWEGWGGWNDREPYPWLAKHVFAWQERWGVSHADVVTVASRALETVVLSLGVPRERVVYLPNGGDLATAAGDGGWARTRWGLGDAPVVLVYTRFFEYQVSRLLAVFARIQRALPKVKFLVVGQGLYGEENELAQRLRAMGPPLATSVVYAGWPGEAALPDIFAAADVALYLLDDTLLNRTKSVAKLLQLLAAGVPVVADAVGQATVYATAEVAGVLVPPGDVEAMAQATVDLLKDDQRRRAISDGACAWVQRHYVWSRLAHRLEQVYLGHWPDDPLP